MKKLIIGAALFCSLAFGNIDASAQGKNAAGAITFGVVDVETIVKEMPEAQEADKKLKEIGQKFQDTLLTLRKDLETKVQQYQKQKAMMPQDQQQKEEELLQSMNMQYMQYQEEKFGNSGSLAVLREKYLEPIRTKVKNSIEEVAKEEKISLVLDKASAAVLYSETKFDLTFRVLDKIKRGASK